uniref:Transmembrane protein n=2 Tax=Pandoraea faecigallinarum TaxID=656179 RepID=A0A0H3X1U5_9BURK
MSMNRVVHVCAMLAATAVLAACSPRYDWREVHDKEGAYAVTYPAKPTQDAREVRFASGPLPMRMQAARVDAALFAVGVVTLPNDDATLRQTVVDELQHGLLANVNESTAAPTQVMVRQAGDAPPLPGLAVSAQGVASDKVERYVSARFVGRGNHVYQVVVMATKAPGKEQVEQFLDSFTLE